MTDFTDCPQCADEWDAACPTCGGSSRRPHTGENFLLAASAKEFADEYVSEFFTEWCELSGTDRAYGVERWKWYGGSLRIVQDTSARSCYNSETHDFPGEWVLAQGEERRALIRASLDKARRAEEEARQAARRREAETLRARLAVLEAG